MELSKSMEKPIEPTPELTGEDARRFLEEMIRRQTSPPSAESIKLAKEIEMVSKSVIRGRGVPS